MSDPIRVRSERTGRSFSISPGSELAVGREGTVYPVPWSDGRVAKLYHRPTVGLERKVSAMILHRPAGAESGALAWPEDLLREPDGRFAGLLLPRVEGKLRADELYDPATRRERSPLFHYGLLHRAARDLASAFHDLHGAGYVVGDVNGSGVRVGEDGLVTLVDTDSFQVRDAVSGLVFRCPVGRPAFTPPELWGRSFEEVDRRPEHDRFGLGVLVFQMLMEGTHPFVGRYRGAGDPPSIQERIAAGHFAYAPRGESMLEPAPSAPPPELMAPALRDLAVRCFVNGHLDPAARPTAEEWRDALEAAEEELVSCRRNDQHRFGPHLDTCPWCERAYPMHGLDPFPSVRDVERGEHLRRRSPGSAAAPPEVLPDAAGEKEPRTPRDQHHGGGLRVALLLALAFAGIGIAMARNGREDGAGTGTARVPAPAFPAASFAYAVEAVHARPVLEDTAAFLAALAALPEPPAAGEKGSALPLRFVVDASGRVDPETVVLWSDPDTAALAGLRGRLAPVRFRPGEHEGRSTRTRVSVDLRWAAGRASPVLESATWNPGVPSTSPRTEPSGGPEPRGVKDVEVLPVLLNGDEVQLALQRLYPPALLKAGIGGSTQTRFVVDREGRVDPSSIVVAATSDGAFAQASATVTAMMRFRPAQVNGRAVPVLVQIPITWVIEKS